MPTVLRSLRRLCLTSVGHITLSRKVSFHRQEKNDIHKEMCYLVTGMSDEDIVKRRKMANITIYIIVDEYGSIVRVRIHNSQKGIQDYLDGGETGGNFKESWAPTYHLTIFFLKTAYKFKKLDDLGGKSLHSLLPPNLPM